MTRPSSLRGEVADAVAVHGQLHGLGRRRDPPALGFERGQRRGVDRLDLRDDDVRAVLLDRRPQRRAVEHREDLERVGALHRRGVGIAVAGDDPAAEALGGDGEFAAELARAEQHQRCKVHGCACLADRASRCPIVNPPAAPPRCKPPPPPPPKPLTPNDIVAKAPAAAWRTIPADDLLVIDLKAGGRVVVQLAPAFAPVHVANIRALARANWWDGAAVYRVQDNYVAQWGQGESEKPFPKGVVAKPPAEYTRRLRGLPVRPLGSADPYAPAAGYALGWPVAYSPTRRHGQPRPLLWLCRRRRAAWRPTPAAAASYTPSSATRRASSTATSPSSAG